MNFKLIQQALVALEMYREYTPEGNGVAEQAIVALKQFKKEWQETEVPYVVVECNCSDKTTLYSPSQPKQEPVAWLGENRMKAMIDLEKQAWVKEGRGNLVETYTIPLYTTPQKRTWVGLTDEEREQVYKIWRFHPSNETNLHLCKAIEAKLKEKNGL